MRKITDFIIDNRYFFLIFISILSIICLIASTNVKINSDIMKYLPKTSETKKGKDIMDKDFDEIKESNLNVMFKDLSDSEKDTMYDKLSKIKGVDSIDYENTEEYNIDNYTLYTLNVKDYDHSKTSKDIYEEVKKLKPKAMSGTIEQENKPVLQLWIVIMAIISAMIILIILSESFVEPLLYLVTIGIAIFINKGTNLMFEDVSHITQAIAAILQLALSMDYSIILTNRYKQEKEHEKDKIKAMKNALYESFKSISSSSVTTIVGLLALVFMSFTIGKDLGYVLAKGVLLSLFTIFLCLPGLLLLFEDIINKTKRKPIEFNLKKLGIYSYKTRYFQLAFIIIAFTVAFLLKGNLGILFTGSEQDEVGKIFPATNQMVIVYKNEYEDLIASYCESLDSDNKVEQALCYSNTINQKLAYNELNNKFEELGQDTEIEEYIIKVIYYNYYNPDDTNKMTLEQFVTFIKNDVYTNDKLNENIDNNTKDNITKLENFIYKNNINKDRTIKDISNILDINEVDAEQILIYYNSINRNNSKITLKKFVDFMYKDIIPDSSYNKDIDLNTKKSLEQLKTFTDKSIINKNLNYKDMTLFINNVLGSSILPESSTNKLYLYYIMNQENNIKLSLNEFASFAYILSQNPEFSSSFDINTLSNLNSIIKFTSNNTDTKLNYKEMAEYFKEYGINETMTLSIYEYYKVNQIVEIPDETISQFVGILNRDDVQEVIKSPEAQNAIANADIIIKEAEENSRVSSEELSNSFIIQYIGIDSNTVEYIYQSTNNDKMNIIEFLVAAKQIGIITDEDVNQELNKVDMMINSYLNNSSLTEEQIAYILNIEKEVVNKVIEYNEKNKEELKLTPYEFVDYLLLDNNKQIVDSIVPGKTNELLLAKILMSNKNNTYTYNELSNFLKQLTNSDSLNSNTLKTIYDVYYYKNNEIKINPYNLVKFIINHKDDDLLKEKVSPYISKIYLINNIMDSTINNTKYNYKELSNLLGIDKDKMSLIMSLYNFKYENNNKTIDLYKFINFIIDNVMNNNEYSDKFDDNTKDKLLTIKAIMNGSLNNTSYNTEELFAILNRLSEVDPNLIDLVYLYNGSINNYDEEWKLTVEQFINYVHDDILKDPKFNDFIDNDMKNKVNDGYSSIKDAHKLLVGEKYSRVVLNTKYPYETEETFEFINNFKEYVDDEDGIYIIGDSPMALEMSKTFGHELNYITILTMIFIFIVVALTFKSLIIPIILVLIIQCAVYITMSLISLFGGQVYFIAILIVQAILMGATIDYAIVLTSYYRESRLTMNIKDSIINAYNKSIHTILCSSSILILVTLIVSKFASAIAAKICETISQGTIASVLLVLLVLPGVLGACDKIICRKGYYKEKKIKE